MKYNIHNNKTDNDSLFSDSLNDQPEENFVNAVVNLVADKISTNHNDKLIIIGLLKNNIRMNILEMLREYDNVVADKLIVDVKLYLNEHIKELDDIEPDYTYVTHAKLDTTLKTIKMYLRSLEELDSQKQQLKEELNQLEFNMLGRHQSDLNEEIKKLFNDADNKFTEEQENLILKTLNIYFNVKQGVQTN